MTADREAFGYSPKQWPPLTTFDQPRSDAQRGKAHASWKERGLDESMFGAARTAVLAEFGFDSHEGKGQTMLWIDFVINATADQIQAAIDAGHAANGQESLL